MVRCCGETFPECLDRRFGSSAGLECITSTAGSALVVASTLALVVHIEQRSLALERCGGVKNGAVFGGGRCVGPGCPKVRRDLGAPAERNSDLSDLCALGDLCINSELANDMTSSSSCLLVQAACAGMPRERRYIMALDRSVRAWSSTSGSAIGARVPDAPFSPGVDRTFRKVTVRIFVPRDNF